MVPKMAVAEFSLQVDGLGLEIEGRLDAGHELLDVPPVRSFRGQPLLFAATPALLLSITDCPQPVNCRRMSSEI